MTSTDTIPDTFLSAYRHAKILATLGPASESPEMLEKLISAGVNAFRLNFSHGEQAEHAARVATIRQTADKMGRRVALLQDLQGPKIRLGVMQAETSLNKGETFTLDLDETPGDITRACLPHPNILKLLKKDDLLLLNDGQVRLQATEATGDRVNCLVTQSGVINSRKGVNLPGVDIPLAALTEKDKKDLAFGLDLGVDWVALSFVQRPEDIADVRACIAHHGDHRPGVMAKIERPNAVQRLEEIVASVDALMVARGDLGVELPLEEVPPIQKKILRLSREAGKPVVVATQMLESMITNASPTRAEVSDVANAAYEGADVLMLSAETAVGKWPVEAVETMAAVIRRVENSSAWEPLLHARELLVGPVVRDAMTAAAHHISAHLNAVAIVTFTATGGTAIRMARERPAKPILALTPSEKTARLLTLVWGVETQIVNDPKTSDDLVHKAIEAVKDAGLHEPGRQVVLVAGYPFGEAGSTNMVRVVTL